MVYFGEFEIDGWIAEDLPSFDLTTHLLGIWGKEGLIRFVARHPAVVCGTEEVEKILNKMGATLDRMTPSGVLASKGECFMEARGSAGALHAAWKVCANILESLSGIATKTRAFVESAQGANPKINVVTTRKSFPGTRKLATKAILCGGAMPHRLGLSESILIFDEHIRFMGGFEAMLSQLDEIRQKALEKKIAVEVHNFEDALRVAKKGIDIIQLDKFSPEETKRTVEAIRSIDPAVRIASAGGVTPENADLYAATGTDILVTSSLYFAKPADIKVEIIAL